MERKNEGARGRRREDEKMRFEVKELNKPVT